MSQEQAKIVNNFIKTIISEYHIIMNAPMMYKSQINLFLNIISVYIKTYRMGATYEQNLKDLGIMKNVSLFRLLDTIRSASTCDQWITVLHDHHLKRTEIKEFIECLESVTDFDQAWSKLNDFNSTLKEGGTIQLAQAYPINN